MTERRVAVRGIELAYFEWGCPVGPTVLMLHATGFHARCWDGVIRALASEGKAPRAPPLMALSDEGQAPRAPPLMALSDERQAPRAPPLMAPASEGQTPDATPPGACDGVHVIAVDQRGHGRSEKAPPYDWAEFGADAAALVEALDLDDIIGVGHSMGGHATVQAAGAHRDRFRSLLLVDPVIMDPAMYTMAMSFRSADDHPVARRRNRWASPEEMFERFKDRHPFNLWVPEILMDYCRFGIVPDGDGFVLGCPPRVEAAIYTGSAGHDIRMIIDRVTQPVVVLRAKARPSAGRHGPADTGAMDFARSPTWAGLAAAFPNGRDVHHPELTHFMPMQAPDLVARHIRDAIADPDTHPGTPDTT